MRLISDDRKPLALRRGEIADGLKREGKGLDSADDDLLALSQRLGKLPALGTALTADRRDHARGPFEPEQRVLKLGVNDIAIRHDDHGGEQLVVGVIMEVGEEVRRPCDRVGFAAAR